MVAVHAEFSPASKMARAFMFASAIFAGFVYAASSTIVNAVLPSMQGDLSAGLDQISWVVTAAVVAGALGLPSVPWLTARFGERRVLLTSLAAFAVAAMMVVLAQSLAGVIAWRAAQSMLGAPVMALSQTIVIANVSPRRRGTLLAAWSIALSCGWMFAPAAGAWIAELYGWRTIFFSLVPLAAIAWLGCAMYVPTSQSNASIKFDFLGFGLLAVALTGVQMVLNRGQRLDWFFSTEIIIWAALSIASIYFYVLRTLSTDRPFLQWQVLLDRNVSVGLAFTGLFAFISLAPLIVLPAMLQQLRGLEVVTVGALLIPRGIAQIAVMLLVGPLIGRVDARLIIATGFICFAWGSYQMSGFNLDIGLDDVLVPLVAQGIAVGLVWLPTFNMIYLTVSDRYRTDAATLIGLTYNIVSSIGVALVVVILMHSLQTNTQEIGQYVSPLNERLRIAPTSMADLKTISGLASVRAEVFRQASMIGYVNVFWVLTIVPLAALPILAFASSAKQSRSHASNNQ